MISVEIQSQPKFANIAEYLKRNYQPLVRRYVSKAINMQAFKLQTHIKKEKLSGQVLKVRTGTLRRSINVVTSTPRTLTALVGVGTDAPYGKTHELGLTTHPSVTEKSRSYFWAMWYQTKENKYKWMALTKKNKFNIKHLKRAFLLPSFEEKSSEIEQALKQSIDEALEVLKEGGKK